MPGVVQHFNTQTNRTNLYIKKKFKEKKERKKQKNDKKNQKHFQHKIKNYFIHNDFKF